MQPLKATFGSPPTVTTLVLMHLISAPSGVPGFGSQASPMPSPTSSPVSPSSVSFWSGLGTRGQLSPRFRKPSPS